MWLACGRGASLLCDRVQLSAPCYALCTLSHARLHHCSDMPPRLRQQPIKYSMQSSAVVALALLDSVSAFQAPVAAMRTVSRASAPAMFSEGDLGVLPPLGVWMFAL